MVLEATVVCLDNSEWMRNGDLPPTRLDAQQDAVNLLCNAKIGQNPENTVGLLTLAGVVAVVAAGAGAPGGGDSDGKAERRFGSGASCRILVTQTQDMGKVLSCLHSVRAEGDVDIVGGVQKAQLALKHRQNKNQRQRIVCFVGSPLTVSQEELVKLGKKLKKNNVAVDVVAFGHEHEQNEEVLRAFVDAVNSNENSRLVVVPPGTQILSDALASTPVVMGEEAAAAAGGGGAAAAGGGGGGGGGGGHLNDFGVDPNMDPELAMALRLSMEEEQARQAAAAAAAAAGDTATGASTTDGSEGQGGEEMSSATAAAESSSPSPSDHAVTSAPAQQHTRGDGSARMQHEERDERGEGDEEEMDEELRVAMELSMQDAHGPSDDHEQEEEEEEDGGEQRERTRGNGDDTHARDGQS